MTSLGSILIIDDEDGLRNTLSRILHKIGCVVVGAATGNEALRLLSLSPYDLVFLDLRLPDMDGLQVLQQIRNYDPKLPVILFTAYGSMDSALKAMHLGATDYLLKPIDPDQLISRTKSVLRDQAIERRRKELQTQIAALQEELRLLDSEVSPETPSRHPPAPPDIRFIRRGSLTLDTQARRIIFGDKEITLPPASFDYFLVLVRHAPDVVSYQTLVTEAQGYQTGISEARELSRWHVHVIRQAFEANPGSPHAVINVRGKGYRLLLD